MVTRDEVLKGRDRDYPLDAKLEQNLNQLLDAVNKLRKVYGKPFIITSGYRPGHYNKSARGAKKSAHMSCQAVDIRDTDGEIAKWCLSNLKLLEEAGLYMESPIYTQTPAARWLHLQTRPTKNRVFIP